MQQLVFLVLFSYSVSSVMLFQLLAMRSVYWAIR